MLPKNFGTTRDEWVTVTKGAKACKMSYTTITNNTDKGRIPFRSIRGKRRVYAPWIANFKGVKTGNPKRIDNPVLQLQGESLAAFERLQESIETTHKDVIYDFDHDGNEIVVSVFLVVPTDGGKAKTVHANTIRFNADPESSN